MMSLRINYWNKYESEDSIYKTINLKKPEGSAFNLLGIASGLCDEEGYNKKKVLNEIRDSDYDNLCKVFEKYFSSYYTLIR